MLVLSVLSAIKRSVHGLIEDHAFSLLSLVCVFMGQPWPNSRSLFLICVPRRFYLTPSLSLALAIVRHRHLLSHRCHLALITHSPQLESAASDLSFALPIIFLSARVGFPPTFQHNTLSYFGSIYLYAPSLCLPSQL